MCFQNDFAECVFWVPEPVEPDIGIQPNKIKPDNYEKRSVSGDDVVEFGDQNNISNALLGVKNKPWLG
jgi:hypothetical protein